MKINISTVVAAILLIPGMQSESLAQRLPAQRYAVPTVDSGEEVSTPCIDDQANPEKSSKCLIGMRKCGAVRTEAVDRVRRNVETQLDYLKKGQQIDIGASREKGEVITRQIEGKVCNPLEGEVGDACPGTRLIAISKSGARIGDGAGTQEIAHLHGMRREALKCHLKTVVNEIRQGRVGISIASQALAADVEKMNRSTAGRAPLVTTEFFESAQNLAENFCQQQDILKTDSNIKVPDICLKGEQAENPEFELSDSVEHRQSACNLAAARAAVEGAAETLFWHEVNTRASNHVHALRDGGADSKFMKDLNRAVAEPCLKSASSSCSGRCKSKCRYSKSKCKRCLEGCIVERSESCYRSNYNAWVTDFFRTNFPAQGCEHGNILGAAQIQPNEIDELEAEIQGLDPISPAYAQRSKK